MSSGFEEIHLLKQAAEGRLRDGLRMPLGRLVGTDLIIGIWGHTNPTSSASGQTLSTPLRIK
jgi:hypothetical protein